MYQDLAEQRAATYRDQAVRRAGLGGASGTFTYQDQAERRAGLDEPSGFGYQDQAERRQRVVGGIDHRFPNSQVER
ncbi:hypothetical protein [Agromyces bauzanensis]